MEAPVSPNTVNQGHVMPLLKMPVLPFCCSGCYSHLHAGCWQNFFFCCSNIQTEKFLWVKTTVGRKWFGFGSFTLIRVFVQLLEH